MITWATLRFVISYEVYNNMILNLRFKRSIVKALGGWDYQMTKHHCYATFTLGIIDRAMRCVL